MNSTKKKKKKVLTCNVEAIYSHLVRLESSGACGHLFYFHRERGDSNESQLGPPDLQQPPTPPPVHRRRPSLRILPRLCASLPEDQKEKTDARSVALECECADLGRRRPPGRQVPEAEGRNLITAFFCLEGALVLTFR